VDKTYRAVATEASRRAPGPVSRTACRPLWRPAAPRMMHTQGRTAGESPIALPPGAATTLPIEALSDLSTPWCVHAVKELDLARHMAHGGRTASDLAAAAGCNARILRIVLAHLARNGVFEETAPGRFALNDTARGLLDPSMRHRLGLDGLGEGFAEAWGTLLQLVRSGGAFQTDEETHSEFSGILDPLFSRTRIGAPPPEVPLVGGWEAVYTAVDVGGGTGEVLAGVLQAHTHLHGTLVDRPRVAAQASKMFEAAGVRSRAAIVGQSFFDPLPSGADVYLLCGVLNDWPDREAKAILCRCAEAARPLGRLVVLNSISAGDPPADVRVEALLLAGRRRTLVEFAGLAREARLIVAASTPYRNSLAVECAVA